MLAMFATVSEVLELDSMSSENFRVLACEHLDKLEVELKRILTGPQGGGPLFPAQSVWGLTQRVPGKKWNAGGPDRPPT